MKWRTAIIFMVIFASLIAVTILLLFFSKRPHKSLEDTIKVGILHSLTGAMAVSEKSLVDAALLAIDEMNESGGLLGKKLVPIIADGKSDWPTFAQEAQRLIAQEGVKAIFGCWSSASRKMVKPIVEKNNILLFYPVQHEGLELSSNIIYLGSTANQQAIPAVTWCLQNLGNKFFLIGTDYIYQRAINAVIKDVVAARSGTVIGEEYVSLIEEKLDKIISRIIENKPDVIINTINGRENGIFFDALRGAGFSTEKIPVISLSVTETELADFDIKSMIGDYAAQDYFESLNTPANNAFVKKFRTKFGNRPISSPMQNTYAAFQFWKNAVALANTTETDAVREQLRGAAISSPAGIISISRNLHAWKPLLIGKIFPTKQFGVIFNSVGTIEPLAYPPFRTKEQWDDLLEYWYTKWGDKWSKE